MTYTHAISAWGRGHLPPQNSFFEEQAYLVFLGGLRQENEYLLVAASTCLLQLLGSENPAFVVGREGESTVAGGALGVLNFGRRKIHGTTVQIKQEGTNSIRN